MTFVERRHGPRDQLVLVVDDHADTREVWCECLTLCGFRTCQAEDGIEAVELAERLNPAVILMDGQMPRLDGYGATKRLKSSPTTMSIPIVLLTANPLTQELVDRAGGDAFLQKPCLPSELLTVLRAMLHAD
jgi:CheY-like chemotaxis protein